MNHHSTALNQQPAGLGPAPTAKGSRVNIKKLTPSHWMEVSQRRKCLGGHKRSASWGSEEHLKEVAKLRHKLQKRSRHAHPLVGSETSHQLSPADQTTGFTQIMPLNRMVPRLRRSVEGLNLELEEVFVSEKSDDQHEILDVPDGHRAPGPAQRCSSESQSDPSPAPMDPVLLSPSQSPSSLNPSLLLLSHSSYSLDPPCLSPSQSPCPMGDPEPVECETFCTSHPPFAPDSTLFQLSSPHPNKTFQREPPDDCERVCVCGENISPGQDESVPLGSCPDPNKVNFTTHGASAFCPVSLLKPILPSMDLLFRGLSVSPVTGCPGQVSPTRQLGMQ